jgi:thiamine-monophosphate kinase
MTLPPEDQLVARLAAAFQTRRRDVLLGIGDDAAVIRTADRSVLATDVMVEGADFHRDWGARRIGKKCVSVNVSDLAAMGAIATHALISFGLPKDLPEEWLDGLIKGCHESAQQYGVAIVGGDLSASPVVFAGVTVVGQLAGKAALTRSGARPGDSIFVSTTLGAAAGGLQLLLKGFRLEDGGGLRVPGGKRARARNADSLARLIRHQLDPRPKPALATALGEERLASAAIDISDGLARDLHRLCRASGTGAAIDQSSLPVDSALSEISAWTSISPLDLALFGGEDYGLLFTVPKRKMDRVAALAPKYALRKIGVIEDSAEIRLIAPGGAHPLPDRGFDHFETPDPESTP